MRSVNASVSFVVKYAIVRYICINGNAARKIPPKDHSY